MLIDFTSLLARARESGNGESPVLETLGELTTRTPDGGTFLETRKAVLVLEAARETLEALEAAVIDGERQAAGATETERAVAVLEG